MARRFTLADGDLLMSRANTRELVGLAGRFTQIGVACIYPDLMMRLRPKAEQCLPGYLEIVLRSASVRRAVQAGARGTSESMVKISASLVEDLRIPLPPLPEQRDIVAAHEAFERRIGALERELAKLRTVENAVVARAMDQCKGRVELGRWLSSIEAGKSPMAEDTPAGDGEWGVLKVSAVQPGWFNAIENKVVREAEFINARYRVCAGDLLMTRANTEELVGLACVVREHTERLMLSDKTLRLVPDTGVAEAEFIELALLSPSVRSQVRSRATGTSASMKNIGQSAVRQLMVPDVPKDMQRKVVAAVSASRKRSQGVQRQIAKLRQVQQGVMEDLLSGRSRANRT
jgi:type I restriction enzyme S subunit